MVLITLAQGSAPTVLLQGKEADASQTVVKGLGLDWSKKLDVA